MTTKTKKTLDHLVSYSSSPLFLLLLAFYPTPALSETPTRGAPELSPYVDTFNLNLLLPPSSPAFVILGISPVSIERPGNPTDFAVSILNSTENFTVLPKNYALEFTPRWLFETDPLEAKDYSEDNPGRNFWQTLTVSLATMTEPVTVSDTFTTSLAVGGRSSLLRGSINSKYEDELDNLLSTFNSTFHEKWKAILNDDSTLKYLDALEDSVGSSNDSIFQDTTVRKDSLNVIGNLINERRKVLRSECDTEFAIAEKTLYKDIKDVVSTMHLTRTGLKIDIAAAWAWDFPQGSYDDYTFTKWGVWLNVGCEGQELGGFGSVRWRHNRLYSDSSSIDAGGRFLFYSPQQLTLSAEFVARYLFEPSSLHYHWDVTADYPFFKNNVVSFSIGKDYGGFQEGKLIASLSFKQGFGSKRPINVGTKKEKKPKKSDS